MRWLASKTIVWLGRLDGPTRSLDKGCIDQNMEQGDYPGRKREYEKSDDLLIHPLEIGGFCFFSFLTTDSGLPILFSSDFANLAFARLC